MEERDLAGHTLLPGFIDSHSHISSYSATINLVHLDDVVSIAQLQEKIRIFSVNATLIKLLKHMKNVKM